MSRYNLFPLGSKENKERCGMKRILLFFVVASTWFAAVPGKAQTAAPAQTVKAPDERVKADILVVVAHPDDEAAVTPYLARAIYDEHKRVAVVFATRGGSGGNDYRREHGKALADIREQEARQACSALGITDVWFLDGKDTASQNVLNSLANWGHGANLEALVRIVRLTRPEVVITWLPGVFIGENHGDHQAAGVLATEAFDLANDSTAFPAQVAGASKRLEQYLENLTPWQPGKLYFFSDAEDQKQFAGTGPVYSVRDISPSQKKPYWRLALDAAKPHLTQFPEDVQRLSQMSEEELNKMMSDPKAGWWPEPMTLIFGKGVVAMKATDDVFASFNASRPDKNAFAEPHGPAQRQQPRFALGGPWYYYSAFREKHGLDELRAAQTPEIGIKAGSTVLIPLVIAHSNGQAVEAKVELNVPAGWKVIHGEGTFRLPEEDRTDLLVEVLTPELGKEELKKVGTQEVIVRGSLKGQPIGEVRLKVLLKASALAQQ
jgi:LmbE family N-acetylglucosaminyl deacetylase